MVDMMALGGPVRVPSFEESGAPGAELGGPLSAPDWNPARRACATPSAVDYDDLAH